MKCRFYLFVATLLATNLLSAQTKQVQLSKFDLQSSAVVTAPGNVLSQKNYGSKNYWFPVTVPCTVLSGLVQNKVYPDPYIGMNNMLIPDASDSFNQQYHLEQYSYLPNEPNPWKKPYWYRTTFSVPASDKGKHFQLIFKGINYRAAVWLNGDLIADSSQMAGMFADYFLDVSKSIKAGDENALAVEIFPLDYPGLPAHPQLTALGDFYENGGPTGDIGKNVTELCSVGWDWIPAVRDRNIGIWQPVYLRTTGQVVISKPHIITDLPKLPDTSTAAISLHLGLTNYSDRAENGNLKLIISPENFHGETIIINRPVKMDAGRTSDISFDPKEVKQLMIQHPKLWWPNGYGQPNLYRMRIQYKTGNEISDDTSFAFGIRTVSSKAVIVNGFTRRDFYVNGERIHITGGAWVPDMMLNRDSIRNDYELHLCRNSNINLVRIWGGGLGETDDFYELADKYGLLVWQDFWITGDTQGEFKGSRDWPLQANVFVRNVISTILRIRNHPSLLVWTGGNEGHAREELYNAMRNNVATLDGTRPFIPCSSGFAHLPEGWKGSWPDDKAPGVYSGGPYSWVDEAHYYQLVDRGHDWLFKDETGVPSQPPYSTLPKIISNLVPDSSLPYPLNNTWGYHDACSGNGKYDIYYKNMVQRYGEPESMKDYCDKMQLMNADSYRAIFEAAEHKLNETGGVMLWKLNAAFPSVIWQVYDWYLEPNAGYYFMQDACEPVHIQLNLDDSSVALVNKTYRKLNSLAFDVRVIHMDGTVSYTKTGTTDINASDVKKLISIKDILANVNDIAFVFLDLKGSDGKKISENVYWFTPNHDFTKLKDMPGAVVQSSRISERKTKDSYEFTLQFSNASGHIAFFVNPQLMNKGEEILPSYWSKNYFSLAPHESVTVTVSCPLSKIDAHAPVMLKTEGWNVKGNTIELERK